MTPHPAISDRELLATCWTSAGDAAPDCGDEVSPVDLRTRIETAADDVDDAVADMRLIDACYLAAGLRPRPRVQTTGVSGTGPIT